MLEPGLVLNGRYVVERELAEGGMAVVYQGRDRVSGNVVAIKCLFANYSNNPVVRERFLDEGRIQMMLDHPNILKVHEVVYDPVLAFVMEFVRGGTLEDELQRGGAMAEQRVVEVSLPVMSALGMAHSRGIIHRDLKPSNILMAHGPGGTHVPKVMDFGVAKMSRVQELTATGTTVGTLHYMSPEQIVGSKKLDGRADIYSMGITLYKLVTGEVPFNASTEFALMMAQVESPPRPPTSVNPRVSLQMEAIILKALEKRPSQRFQTIKAFTEALIDLLEEHGPQEVSAETVSVPQHLLRFALMSDEVAVDRTDEVLTSRLTASEREARTRNIGSGEDRYNSGPLGLVDDAGNATVEIDAGLLREIRVSNDAVGEAGSTIEMPAAQDYDDAETALVERPNFARALPQDSDVTMLRPQRMPMADRTQEDSVSITTPVAPRSMDRPPSVFGPMDVDTSDQTRPTVVKDDNAGSMRIASDPNQRRRTMMGMGPAMSMPPGGPPGHPGGPPAGPPVGMPPSHGYPHGHVPSPGPFPDPSGASTSGSSSNTSNQWGASPPPLSGMPQGSQRAQVPMNMQTANLPDYPHKTEDRSTMTIVLIFALVALAAFGCTALGWILFHKFF